MPTVEQHFAKAEPTVRAIYDAVLAAAAELGPFEEDPKKTSIHLNRRSAFAGVSTRRDALILTVKSRTQLDSSRPHKQEQASANRWHVDVRLTAPAEVDAEVRTWLAHSYAESA